MLMEVPVIDIKEWLDSIDGMRNVSIKWNDAFSEFGCAVIIGHGIPEELFTRLNQESKSFFSKSVEEKMRYNHGKYGHPLGGYTSPGNEVVALSSIVCESTVDSNIKFDPVENFVFTSTPNNYVSQCGLKSPIHLAEGYYKRMESLLATIHSISCEALGIQDHRYFDKFYNSDLNKDLGLNGNSLRLAYYPSVNDSILNQDTTNSAKDMGIFEKELRYGAHTDYQGFTILRPDKSDWHEVLSTRSDHNINTRFGGLEVFHRGTGQWVAVKIPQHLNALVINAGDLIQRWTNDKWHSPIHRVKANATTSSSTVKHIPTSTVENESEEKGSCDDNGDKLPRQSIVFFSGPCENCIIENLLPHINGEPNPDKYPPIRSGEHLRMKLDRTSN